MAAEPVLCPSYMCESGAILLGIVLPNGRVAFSHDRVVVDDEFVRIAKEGRAPEKRFRFSGPCVGGACKQWDGTRCGVIEDIIHAAPPDFEAAGLPRCLIRDRCRWFSQRGGAACMVCPDVVTDARIEIDESRLVDGVVS